METASAYRVCLFGPPDPANTVKLLREQFETERRRALDRWGFDILEGKLVSPTKKSRKTPSRKKSCDKENGNLSRKATPRKTPYEVSNVLQDRSNNYTPEKVDDKDLKPDLAKSRPTPRKLSLEFAVLQDGESEEFCKTPSKSNRNCRPSQTRVSDYWRSRKFSESSSCSDKEN